mmetsp:Transcript_70467/g.229111  ORF Transcript_70467/g.229111 Transcript_70467/m.229111 type:complete len:389 (-) Transcript_70467:248-1414(-)
MDGAAATSSIFAPPASTGGKAQGGDEETSWTEVFSLLQDCGLTDRGAHYALAIASLKRKSEDVQQQLDALRLAEGSLLQAARDEAQSRLTLHAEPRPGRDAKQARTWGNALAGAVSRQAREASVRLATEEPPYAATELAQEAQEQVRDAFESQAQQQAQAQAHALAQAEHTLMLQAEAVAQAKTIAECQAQALSEAQAQAEIVAEMQLQLQSEVQQAAQAQEIYEIAVSERAQLRTQGLNSKKLPLRPGVPPCGYFMRRGECKYGKACKWDHPEALMTTKGFPRRIGEQPCAFFIRTGVCKFGLTCKFDHPENVEAYMTANALGDDSALQLAALTQALQQAGLQTAASSQEDLQKQLAALLGVQALDPSALEQAIAAATMMQGLGPKL